MFSRDLAGLAARPASPEAPLIGEVVDLAWLRARAGGWDALAATAVDPNPFLARSLIEAHVRAGIAGADLRFLVVHRGGDLRALAAVAPPGARLGLRRAQAPWTSRFLVVNATPLLAAGDHAATLDRLLDAAARMAGPSLWRWPLLRLASATGRALEGALQRRGWTRDVRDAFERPVLDRAGDYETYAGAHRSRARRKRLLRQRERLAALGAMAHRSATGGPELPLAVERFLALERAGWKGARGTALASRASTAALARAAFAAADGPVSVRADLLVLDDAPVAISLALLAGGTAYLLKTAYDERFRAYAPGLLLEDEIIRAFYATGFAERLDSASDANSVLDGLYPGREPMGELVFSTDPAFPPAELQGLLAREKGVEALRRALARRYWRALDAKAAWFGRRDAEA